MEEALVSSVALDRAAIAAELSVWRLFVQADIIVKAVLLILIFASFWVWAVIFEKSMRLRKLGKLAERFEKLFWSGGSLEELYDRIGERASHPMSALFAAAMREWRRSTEGTGGGGLATTAVQQRIGRAMEVTLAREQVQLEKYMGFLASVGSTAPFIGLFGTVWGIMNSFQSIAASKDTSLAVVAPGIAEALFATALGLVAAVPAVAAYNKFSTDINHYTERLENFASEFQGIVSRQLEGAATAYAPRLGEKPV